MAKLSLSAPWIIYYRELQELFKKNIDVKVVFDEENYEIKIYVQMASVAYALSELLPTEKAYGSITLKITVIPANGTEKLFKEYSEEEHSKKDLIYMALSGNEAVSYIWDVSNVIPGLDIFYVVFVNKVVQYYTDTMADPHGLTSTLYENIARDIFGEIPGVYFCTNVPED